MTSFMEIMCNVSLDTSTNCLAINKQRVGIVPSAIKLYQEQTQEFSKCACVGGIGWSDVTVIWFLSVVQSHSKGRRHAPHLQLYSKLCIPSGIFPLDDIVNWWCKTLCFANKNAFLLGTNQKLLLGRGASSKKCIHAPQSLRAILVCHSAPTSRSIGINF